MNEFDESKHPRNKDGKFKKKDAGDIVVTEDANKVEQIEEYIYTETEYNSFGWVLKNGIIPYGKYKDFESKFAEATSNPKSAYNKQKTSQGEYMIPVNDILDKVFEGVNNTIVYAKGKIDNPIITRILNIDEYDETNLDRTRRMIYASERRGIQPKDRGFYRFYYSTNFRYNRDFKRNGEKGT